MNIPREGYPLVPDEAHPLWEAQQDGWPDHMPHEAWAAMAAHEPKKVTSSSKHPAFSVGYLTNNEATRPEAKVIPTPIVTPPPKERR